MEKDFRELIKKNEGILTKIINLYSYSRADRDDLRQEILIQLWKSFPKYKGNSRFSTWMYKVSLNTAITYIKKNSRNFKFVDYRPQIPDVIEENNPATIDDVKQLYSAISLLSKIDRAIVILHLDKFAHKEIAEIIGVTERTLNVKLYRIKEKLKEILNN